MVRICPGSALAISLAARLTASPLTEYVRRYAGPKSLTKIRPQLTPMRSGSGESASMTARIARNIASSSLPVLRGAPAMSITFPPLGAMSVSKKATWMLVGARCDDADDGVERIGERVGTLLGEHLVSAHEVDEGRRHRTVLRLATAGQQMLPDAERHELRKVEVGNVADRRKTCRVDLGRTAEEDPRPLRCSEAAGGRARRRWRG